MCAHSSELPPSSDCAREIRLRAEARTVSPSEFADAAGRTRSPSELLAQGSAPAVSPFAPKSSMERTVRVATFIDNYFHTDPDPLNVTETLLEPPRELASGLRSTAIRVHILSADDEELDTRVVLVPSGVDFDVTHDGYERIAAFLRNVAASSDSSAQNYFPKLYDAHTGPEVRHSPTDVPALIMEDARWGTMHDAMKKGVLPDPVADPLATLDLMLAISRGVAYLHGTYLTHGDIKLDNFLVTGPEGALRVLLGDLGELTTVGRRASGLVSAAYVNVGKGVHGAFGMLRAEATFERDLYALMVCDQEILLQKRISALSSQLVARHSAAGISEKGEAMALRVSPDTIRPALSPVLASLAWVPAPSIASRMNRISIAKTYLQRGEGDRFVEKYFGPSVLAEMSDADLAPLIASSDLFYAHFVSDRLGLAPARSASLREAVEKRRAAAAQ